MTKWIEWNGGKCPVSDDTIVRVKFPGEEIGVGFAWAWDWNHKGDDCDIIAYLIVKEK